MRILNLVLPIWFLVVLALIFAESAASAAGPLVRDGGNIQVGDITFKLDGVDAPEVDQICIDDHADPWTCGIEARDQLTKLIKGRNVRCDDLGPDKIYKKRHVGLCTAEGDTLPLNQQLVGVGFAVSGESIKGYYKDDEAVAKEDRKGLRKGCFVAPRDYRLGKKDGSLLGSSCRADRDREIRAALFPEDLT